MDIGQSDSSYYDLPGSDHSPILLPDEGGWNGQVEEETPQVLKEKEAMWEKGRELGDHTCYWPVAAD